MSSELLEFRRYGWSILLVDCPQVVDGVLSVLSGWDLGSSKTRRRKADVVITRTSSGYTWQSAVLPKPKLWDDVPPKIPMNVVSDIHDVAFDWLAIAKPDLLLLHAAAMKIGGGLVCFPAVGKAGKTSLCLELTAAGARFFCDDVLAIQADTLKGQALGVAPMMRRPYPRQRGSRAPDFIDARIGLARESWAYIQLSRSEMAQHGDTAPIRSIVLLDRKPGARARLSAISAADTLREMIRQNFGCRGDRTRVLSTLHEILGRANCYRLQYASLRSAADLILELMQSTQRPATRRPAS